MDFHSLIVDFAVIFGSATLGAIICNFFRIPPIVGFIVSGIAIGPSGLALIDSLPGAALIAELGVIFLLFTIGLELSITSLKMHKRLILVSGTAQLGLTCVATAVICYFFLGQDFFQSIFWGFLTTLSSTAIVMKLLVDTRETNSTHGKASTGVLLTQDMAVIPLTLITPLLATSHSVLGALTMNELGDWLIRFLLIGFGIFLGAKFVVPKFLELAAKSKSRELFFFAIIILCLSFALAFESLNLSLAFGAFLAGLLIAESPFGKKAASDVVLMRDSFLALFFCSVGMLVDLSFVFDNLATVIGLTVLVLVGKFSITTFASYLAKVPLRSAMVAGAMTFQIGEFSFVLAELGKSTQLLSETQFQLFLGITVLSMIVTPFAFVWAPKLLLPNRSATAMTDEEQKDSGPDVLIIGFGVVGQETAHTLKLKNFTYRIIEHNYSSVKQGLKEGEPIVFGDGADLETLEHNGINSARAVVVCVSGIKSTQSVVYAAMEAETNAPILARTIYTAEKAILSNILDEESIIDSEGLAASVLAQKLVKILET